MHRTTERQLLRRFALGAFIFFTCEGFLRGEDWPQWGRNRTRNMASAEKGLPTAFALGEFIGASDEIDLSKAQNLRWAARLGSQSYGTPTVAGGRIFVGTNNDAPRDPRMSGDRSVVYCFDEGTGKYLWQLCVPKLGTGQVSDWEYVGMCSSPAVDGERVYLVTNRCEVICLDIDGMADGNDGPFQEEGQYMAGPGEKPLEVTKSDADIIWVLDMMKTCGVAPHNVTASSVLVVGDQVWATTSNGWDVNHEKIPAPDAPCLIAVDKHTGALLGREASGLSRRMFHCNWTSPAYLKTAELEQVIFGGPDGYCYAFSTEPVDDGKGGKVLREIWRCDVNPPEYREKDGEKIPYGKRKGPSEVIGTPAVYAGRVYALLGQDPDHGQGVGNLVCIDPSGTGDVTKSKILWSYGRINRSMASMAIADDLLFAVDLSGFVYCLDALSGEEYWRHDTMAQMWAGALVAGGKLYVGNEDGYVIVLPATKEYDKKAVIEIEVGSPLYSSLIAANGVLYLSTHTHLFALAEKKSR